MGIRSCFWSSEVKSSQVKSSQSGQDKSSQVKSNKKERNHQLTIKWIHTELNTSKQTTPCFPPVPASACHLFLCVAFHRYCRYSPILARRALGISSDAWYLYKSTLPGLLNRQLAYYYTIGRWENSRGWAQQKRSSDLLEICQKNVKAYCKAGSILQNSFLIYLEYPNILEFYHLISKTKISWVVSSAPCTSLQRGSSNDLSNSCDVRHWKLKHLNRIRKLIHCKNTSLCSMYNNYNIQNMKRAFRK